MLFKKFRNRREKSLTIMCFLSNICFTLKLKNLIYINQRIIKISEKSATKQLNCVIKIFASISMMNRILYNQKRIFFNVFKRSRYSCLMTS